MYDIGFEHWIFMFFVFCMIGWVHETTVESLYHKKFINRGSLHGPYIPVYGFGGCVMVLCACPFKDNGFFVFLSGLICCTVLEYFTGWLMETLFHKQFWDYSMMKLTYKNRISLLSSLCWGAMSLLMAYILFPFMKWFGLFLGSTFMIIFDSVMALAMSVDMVVCYKEGLDWRKFAKKLTPAQIKAALQKKRRQVGNIFGHFTAALRRDSRKSDSEDIKITDTETNIEINAEKNGDTQ